MWSTRSKRLKTAKKCKTPLKTRYRLETDTTERVFTKIGVSSVLSVMVAADLGITTEEDTQILRDIAKYVEQTKYARNE